MRVIVITPPDPILAWADANARLRLDSDVTQQADVEAMIAAATGNLDGPAGWLGRSLGPQTLEARFDTFIHGGAFEQLGVQRRHGNVPLSEPIVINRIGHSTLRPLRLPFLPIIDILSVKYLDTNGVLQMLDPSLYELYGDDLAPAYGTSWPAARHQREAVRVQYRAGYAADPLADPLVAAIPMPIQSALLLMIGDLYNNRETTLDGRKNAAVEIPMSTTVEALLGPYRAALVS